MERDIIATRQEAGEGENGMPLVPNAQDSLLPAFPNHSLDYVAAVAPGKRNFANSGQNQVMEAAWVFTLQPITATTRLFLVEVTFPC